MSRPRRRRGDSSPEVAPTPTRYQFIVSGTPSPLVMQALPELSLAPYPAGGSALYGPVRDDSDLFGLMARLLDLGLQVVEARRLPD